MMGFKAVEISFCLIVLVFLTVHARRRGWNGRNNPWNREDPDDDLHSDIPESSGQSAWCLKSQGYFIYCELGCCTTGHDVVCCTASSEDSDDKTHTAAFVLLGVFLGLFVACLVAFIVIRLCKASTTKTRRTAPSTVAVKQVVVQPQSRQPTQPRRSRRQTERPRVHENSRTQDIFTVTPILPSYADATGNIETNRPPPAYSICESNIENDYLRNFISPPPPYVPDGSVSEETRSSQGRYP